MVRKRHVVGIACIALGLQPAVSRASCGSAACPLDTRTGWELEKCQLRLGYEFEFIDQDQPRIGAREARAGEISGHHDEQRTINRIHRAFGSWGVTERFQLDLALPVVSRSHRHIHNHHRGQEITPQGWDVTGLGDLAVQGRYAFFKPAEPRHLTVSGIVGIEFPTGRSETHNASGDPAEPGITPGSASYDVTVGGSALWHARILTPAGAYAWMPLFASVTYKINGKGRNDYRLGNTLQANVGLAYPLLSRLAWMSQLNFWVREKDDRGQTREEVEKTGGEFLYYSPGLRLHLSERWEWSALAQIPIRQRVNRIQLTSDYNLLSSISYTFGIR